MHISVVAALIFLDLGALGAPTQARPPPIAATSNSAPTFNAAVFQRNYDAIAFSGTNDCWDDDYSYNKTGVGNFTATVVNCQQIVYNTANMMEWTVNPGDVIRFIHEDCAFEVKNPFPPSLNPQPGPASFGNGDVIRAIEKLIERNQGNGRVDGIGTFTCPDLKDDVSTQTLEFYLNYNFALDGEASHGPDISARDSARIHSATTLFRKSDDEADTEHCWDYSFSSSENTTSDSPLVADCQQMLTNIAGDGDWMLGWKQTRQLVQYGTCAFTAENNYPGKGFVRVGNVDIIHVVSELIESNQTPEGRVGGAGYMNCSDIHKGNSDYLRFWLNRNDLSLAPEIPEDGGAVSAPQQSAETGLAARDSDAPAGEVLCKNDELWDQTSQVSMAALISDCEQMVRNIAGDGGWTIPVGLHRVITYQSCALNAEMDDLSIIKIGNGDLIRIITAMIEFYGNEYGWISAHGQMDCQGLGDSTISGVLVNVYLFNPNAHNNAQHTGNHTSANPDLS
ncbi:putative necrosis-inducing factor-domain-containing protein [Immersiella caudata]|uniref:Necrosis-inducing factor-domain-containing protein n=1 Tax=Immersiella caudata TaxID=314043 RepID=A0AA39TXB0_9PEZI|nr:putative necrosis-inducing factor-domain-containing protein [Immersiella caudata]